MKELYLMYLDDTNGTSDITRRTNEWRNYELENGTKHYNEVVSKCNVVKTIELDGKDWVQFSLYFKLPNRLWDTIFDGVSSEPIGIDYNVVRVRMSGYDNKSFDDSVYITVPYCDGGIIKVGQCSKKSIQMMDYYQKKNENK